MTEKWKDIPGSAGYQVSTRGRVRRTRQPSRYKGKPDIPTHLLKLRKTHNNSMAVNFELNGKKASYMITTLMRLAFFPEADGRRLYHINGDNSDNRIENLRLTKPPHQRGQRKPKRIEKIDRAGNVIAVYSSVKEAAESSYYSEGGVYVHVSGRIKKPFMRSEFTFRYAEDQI